MIQLCIAFAWMVRVPQAFIPRGPSGFSLLLAVCSAYVGFLACWTGASKQPFLPLRADGARSCGNYGTKRANQHPFRGQHGRNSGGEPANLTG